MVHHSILDFSHNIYKRIRSWTTLETLNCQKVFIGLGKNHPLPFVHGLNPPSLETTVTVVTTVTATDLDRTIIGFMPPSPPRSSANIFFASHCFGVPHSSLCLLPFCDLNIDHNDLAEQLPSFSRRRVPCAVKIQKPISAMAAAAREPRSWQKKRNRHGARAAEPWLLLDEVVDAADGTNAIAGTGKTR